MRNAISFQECLPYLAEIRNTVDRNNPKTLWAAFDLYLSFCGESGLLISNQSAYYSVGCSKETINAWYHRTRRQHNPEYHAFADHVKTICACAREQYGLEGVVNPIMTIWHQKFFDGFTDTPQENDIRNPLGDLVPPDEVIKHYRERRVKDNAVSNSATGAATGNAAQPPAR